jgi:hypothetical protein
MPRPSLPNREIDHHDLATENLHKLLGQRLGGEIRVLRKIDADIGKFCGDGAMVR